MIQRLPMMRSSNSMTSETSKCRPNRAVFWSRPLGPARPGCPKSHRPCPRLPWWLRWWQPWQSPGMPAPAVVPPLPSGQPVRITFSMKPSAARKWRRWARLETCNKGAKKRQRSYHQLTRWMVNPIPRSHRVRDVFSEAAQEINSPKE